LSPFGASPILGVHCCEWVRLLHVGTFVFWCLWVVGPLRVCATVRGELSLMTCSLCLSVPFIIPSFTSVMLPLHYRVKRPCLGSTRSFLFPSRRLWLPSSVCFCALVNLEMLVWERGHALCTVGSIFSSNQLRKYL
jgi:hypothetical protein